MRKWISVVALLLATGAGTSFAQDDDSSSNRDAVDAPSGATSEDDVTESQPAEVDASTDDVAAPAASADPESDEIDDLDGTPADASETDTPNDPSAEPRSQSPSQLRRPADRATGSTPQTRRATSTEPEQPADREEPTTTEQQRASYDAWRAITQAELAAPTESYPFVEWHGYFRFRSDSFWKLDLGTGGTSPIAPPIEALVNADGSNSSRFASYESRADLNDGTTVSLGEYQKNDANFISSANIRFRLNPIFHVTERASIHIEMDILDNLVMGSTPYQEGSIAFFSDGQQSPTAGEFARSAIRVNQAYGKVSAFFGTLQVGRMVNDWGLGMLFNGGGSWSHIQEPRTSYRGVSLSGHGCLDCDEGDYVDRAMLKLNLFNHYFMLAYDFNISGPTWGHGSDTQIFGQPRDTGQFDDSRSFVLAAYKRPESAEEIGERNRRLRELRKPAFDYGAYFMYKQQRITSEYCADDIANPLENSPTTPGCIQPRGAKAFIPDVWLRLQYEPRFRRRVRVEFEGAAILGQIDYPGNDFEEYGDSRDLRQFGAALEFEYQSFALATGFNAGIATGRDMSDESSAGWGIQDGADPTLDRSFSAFTFDKNYFVDMLMFREIVGGISNAAYLNPFFKYDLYAKQNDVLGVRLDLISAVALQSDATPSGHSFYGVEANLGAYYRQPRYGADLTAGIFLPGSVFRAEEGRERLLAYRRFTGDDSAYSVDEDGRAKPAFTLQARFFWAF